MNDLEKISILLVEDNATDAELTMRALRKNKLGNDIVWAQDGAQALDFIFCQGTYQDRPNVNPGLILLDLKLPKVDGIQVLQRIRANESTHAIPVVILTSSAEERDITASYNLGVNSYIVKPVEFDKFLEVVAEAGCYWILVNKPPVQGMPAQAFSHH
ncbi:MAG: response regulator [Burkholderiales bacterium]|nr:response regulator [Burkholderiales bacterium]